MTDNQLFMSDCSLLFMVVKAYLNTILRRSSNGHESLSALIIDEEDDILGNIVLFVFDNVDPYESELVVGYEDMEGLIKAEKKYTDDL